MKMAPIAEFPGKLFGTSDIVAAMSNPRIPLGPSMASDAKWPVVMLTYDPAIRASYYEGKQFRIWFEQYKNHYLFCKRMCSSHQIPHSGPLKGDVAFFHEFFIGTQYLDAGYEALFFYRKVEDEACYEKASELLGGSEAAQFITPNDETGGRAPDLLVFDPRTNHFRFVECKGKSEGFTKSQIGRFVRIEERLNNSTVADKILSDPRPENLFPPLATRQWIHIARLKPWVVRARPRSGSK